MNRSEKPATAGLIDGKMKEGESQIARSASCSTSRIWMILAIVFFATSIALAAYVAYFKITEKSTGPLTDSEIVKKYPGYFRTSEEQAVVEEKFREEYNITPANITYPQTVQYRNSTCRFECQQPARFKRATYVQSPLMEYLQAYIIIHKMSKRQTPSTAPEFHGCCISTGWFTSPNTAEDDNDKIVTVVQFGNKKQYFYTENCQLASGCTGCDCGQKNKFVTAVVRDGNEVTLRLIKIKGCCKCFNNL